MSDLQCAATVVVLGVDATTTAVADLRERRAALVYFAGPGTTTAATTLAEELDVTARLAAGGDAGGHGITPHAGPSPGDGWIDDVLQDLADEHRGECVVLVLDDDARAGLARRSGRDPAERLVIDLDDDGRRVGR